jgi:hypothetical protein
MEILKYLPRPFPKRANADFNIPGYAESLEDAYRKYCDPKLRPVGFTEGIAKYFRVPALCERALRSFFPLDQFTLANIRNEETVWRKWDIVLPKDAPEECRLEQVILRSDVNAFDMDALLLNCLKNSTNPKVLRTALAKLYARG